MDLSASNQGLWQWVLQLGYLGAIMLLANVIRREIPFFRKSLLPTAVIGGFLALALRLINIVPLDVEFMEGLTYHMTALGFIALTLRIPRKNEITQTARERHDGLKSGALIVSCYLVQALLGLIIAVIAAETFAPGFFKASGLLLPMGYGQGPGQANNIGNTYEALGFKGGAAFGLGLAAMGFVWACIGGVAYLNYIVKKKKLKIELGTAQGETEINEPVADEDEIPLVDAVDKFTIQVVMCAMVYLVTYLITLGLTSFIANTPALSGLAKTVTPLLWGFNFLIGTVLALILKAIFSALRKCGVMKRRYTNNYLLNRISGSAFDLMIIASISAINIGDLEGLWIPFILMTTLGGVVTLWYCVFAAKRIYKGYEDEGIVSMYGMMTGTVSNGVLLLRELDPQFKTPAANNLVVGTTSAILLGFPLLILIGMAPDSDLMLYITMGCVVIYGAILNIFLFRRRKVKSKVDAQLTNTSRKV